MLFNRELYQEDLRQAMSCITAPQGSSFLITGATGLIGSFLTDALICKNRREGTGYKICGTSRRLSSLERRFPYVTASDLFYPMEHDITTPLPQDVSWDYIINCASNADPASYARYPAETVAANVLGTRNILEYLKSHSACRMLFTSTMEVYGEIPGASSFSEDDFGCIDFNQVRSGYPESKRTAELLIRSYAEEYNISAVIARLGYIYGPTMTEQDNKAAAQFIRKAIKDEPIVLKSKGSQRRSYCYVSDAAAGIFTALFAGERGQAYNIANPASTLTIAELAETAASLVQQEVLYESPDDLEQKGFSQPRDAVLDASRLMSLGYTPIHPPASGLLRTISLLT